MLAPAAGSPFLRPLLAWVFSSPEKRGQQVLYPPGTLAEFRDGSVSDAGPRRMGRGQGRNQGQAAFS